MKVGRARSAILIQNSASSLGGVETLVARIARGLLARGMQVFVVILQEQVNASTIRIIPDGCQIVCVSKPVWNDWLFPRGIWRRYWKDILPQECELILSFSAAGAMVMRLLRRAHFPSAVELLYVVHPKMLYRPNGEAPPYLGAVVESLAPASVFFMNPGCRQAHVDAGLVQFANSKVVPLPVDPLVASIPLSEGRRIVSVGRIQPGFKNYNWTFLAPFGELADKHHLTWEIFGGGDREDVSSLLHAIENAGLRERVFYRGELPYANLAETLAGAFAFLGMGTAAVEAASLGVPTIIASAYADGPAALGLIQDVPFPVLGEVTPGCEQREIKDVLLTLLQADAGELEGLREKSRQHAKHYSLDGFCDYLDHVIVDGSSQHPPISGSRIARLATAYAAWRVVKKTRRVFRGASSNGSRTLQLSDRHQTGE